MFSFHHTNYGVCSTTLLFVFGESVELFKSSFVVLGRRNKGTKWCLVQVTRSGPYDNNLFATRCFNSRQNSAVE